MGLYVRMVLVLFLISFVSEINGIPNWILNVIDPTKGSTCAAEEMWNAYQDMINAKWKNCDKYFHCRGNYDAQKKCGVVGKAAAAIISNLREWAQGGSDHGSDSEADQEANRFGRGGGDCQKKYITDTIGKGKTVECSLPVNLRKWKP